MPYGYAYGPPYGYRCAPYGGGAWTALWIILFILLIIFGFWFFFGAFGWQDC